MAKQSSIDEVAYKSDVRTFKQLYNDASNNVWAMAEIAAGLETKYGKGITERFAKDVGLSLRTIESYRTAIKTWPEKRGRPRFFEIASALGRLRVGDERPTGEKSTVKRYELLAKKPDMTREEAREIVRAVNNKRKPVLDPANCLMEAAGRFNAFFANGNSQIDDLIGAAYDTRTEIQDHYIKIFHEAIDGLIDRLTKARKRFKARATAKPQLKEISRD